MSGTSATRRPQQRLLASPWWRAVVVVACLWAGTMLVVVATTGAIPTGPAVHTTGPPDYPDSVPPPDVVDGFATVTTGLTRYDALWYLGIAAEGYPAGEAVPPAAAFFPGYPIAIAGVGILLGGRLLVAAHLVSLLAAVAALAGVHRLASAVLPGDAQQVARRSVLVAASFPTAFFLLAPYTEALFLALATWSLVHAARGRPWLAALLAGAATITRPVGVLLVLPLLLGVVPAGGAGGDGGRPPVRDRAVAATGVATAFALLAAYGWATWGDPLAMRTAQAGWQRDLASPLTTLFHAGRFALMALADGSTPYHLLDLLVLLATTAGIAGLVRHRQWPLLAHALGNVVLWLAQPFAARPLMSTPRFALVVPGVFLGLALLLRRPSPRHAWFVVAGALLALHLTLYTRWYYVF